MTPSILRICILLSILLLLQFDLVSASSKRCKPRNRSTTASTTSTSIKTSPTSTITVKSTTSSTSASTASSTVVSANAEVYSDSLSRPVMFYYETWLDSYVSDASKLDILNVDSRITHLLLAFVSPACTYKKGSKSWSGTGLSFSSDFEVVVEGIAKLKQERPEMMILLSIGGATYTTKFSNLKVDAIKDLVDDLGIDGVDIDYEGSSADDMLKYVEKLVAVMPFSDYDYTMTGFPEGCFGSGKYASEESSDYNGAQLKTLEKYGSEFKAVSIMAYNVDSSYSPTDTFDSYRDNYAGPLALGLLVGKPDWGSVLLTTSTLATSVKVVKGDSLGGIMIWVQDDSSGTPTETDIYTAFFSS